MRVAQVSEGMGEAEGLCVRERYEILLIWLSVVNLFISVIVNNIFLYLSVSLSLSLRRPELRFQEDTRVECRIGPHPVRGWYIHT